MHLDYLTLVLRLFFSIVRVTILVSKGIVTRLLVISDKYKHLKILKLCWQQLMDF